MSDYLGHESEYRGDAIVAKRNETQIVIMGIGALGSKLVNLLATQGYHRLRLADRERVEAKNYGTQDFGRRDVGRMKASQSRANLFARLGPIKGIEAIDKEVTAGSVDRLIRGADLVLDCFDNHESRTLIKTACGDKIPCLHIGMSGDGFAEIEWNENYHSHPAPAQVDDDGNPCEYPLAANLVHLTVGLAAEIINKFVDEGKRQSVHFTLKDFHSDVVWKG